MDATLTVPPHTNGRYVPGTNRKRLGVAHEKLTVEISKRQVRFIALIAAAVFTGVQALLGYAMLKFVGTEGRNQAEDYLETQMPAFEMRALEIADRQVAAALFTMRREAQLRHEALLEAIKKEGK